MAEIKLRYQKVNDAKRFYEILNNPNFSYFDSKPPSVKAEKEWLKKNPEKRRKNQEYNYAILYDGKLAGGCGIKIDQNRKNIGEIGYFIDEKFWGKGIATKAVRLLEKTAFQKLKLNRLQILMDPRNKASEKVAIKCGYKKEGTLKKATKVGNEFYDRHLYAKVK